MHKFVTLCFFGLLIFAPLLWLLEQDDLISVREARTLSRYDDIFNGSWDCSEKGVSICTKFERYYADHFGLRQTLVDINSFINFGLFGRSGWIYKGYDGYLFYLLPQIQDPRFIYTRALHHLVGNERFYLDQNAVINVRRENIQRMDVPYYFVNVPHKRFALQDKLPSFLRTLPQSETPGQYKKRTLFLDTPKFFIDTTPVLLLEHVRHPTFLKTDSHWSDWGAYVAYRFIVQRFGIEPMTMTVGDLPLTRVRGDLVRRFPPFLAPAELAPLLPKDSPRCYDDILGKEEQRLIQQYKLNVWSAEDPNRLSGFFTVTECPKAALSEKTILILHDSFMINMKYYLSNTFRKVIYARRAPPEEFVPGYIEDLIRTYRPNIVIEEIVDN